MLAAAARPGQVFTSSMKKVYTIKLDDFDLGQALDGLSTRAEAWEKTADYMRSGSMPRGEFFLIEECRDAEEADQIAAHYRSIIDKVEKQMEGR
jgi:hypothetical protein